MVQQRHLDRHRVANSLNTLLDRAEDMGMSDLLELSEGFGVTEDDSAKLRSVDRAILDNFRPASGYVGKRCAAHCNDLMAHGVSVHREEAMLLQESANGALTAADSATDHPLSLMAGQGLRQ